MKNLGPLLTALLVPIVVPIAMRALSRSAVSDHVPGRTSVELRYGVPMKVLGVLGLALGAFMLIWPVVLRPRGSPSFGPHPLLLLLFSGPIGCSMIFVFLDAFLVRHSVDLAGITCRSVFHRPFRFAWDEIKAVDYNAGMNWFVLRSMDGRVGRVSPYIAGIRTFAELSIAHLDRSVFTDLAWKRMGDAAAGEPA
ncbi:hypothetical protein WME90_06985 [Sorangium sp. So ce375]|uniref:hypothetical protein n=1 Tax=Sorangium sp. So ce375 TaxID=3133306 RepID=UPI003F5BAD9C